MRPVAEPELEEMGPRSVRSAFGCRLASVVALAMYVESRPRAVVGEIGRVVWWVVGGREVVVAIF